MDSLLTGGDQEPSCQFGGVPQALAGAQGPADSIRMSAMGLGVDKVSAQNTLAPGPSEA